MEEHVGTADPHVTGAGEGDERGTYEGVGTLTMSAGGLFIIGALGSIAVDAGWIVILGGFGLLLYVIPKLHAYQEGNDAAVGSLGSWLVLGGGAVVVALGAVFLVWEALGDPAEVGVLSILWMIGFFAFVIGVVLFGVGAIISRRFGLGPPVLVLVGMVAAVAIDMATGAFFEEATTTTQWGFYIGVPLFGLGLVWLGFSMWDRGGSGQEVADETVEAP